MEITTKDTFYYGLDCLKKDLNYCIKNDLFYPITNYYVCQINNIVNEVCKKENNNEITDEFYEVQSERLLNLYSILFYNVACCK